MKIVINRCHGGFGLSRQAIDMICERKGVDPGEWDDRHKYYSDFSDYDAARNDKDLVEVVEQLGAGANGHYAELCIVDIPDDVKWEIAEYDGMEWVAEQHRTWR